MEKIKYNDIDFKSLEKLKLQGTKATLYKDGDVCFKILEGLYDEEKEMLYRKFLDMDIAEKVLNMPQEKRMEFRKKHPYKVLSKTCNFK